MERHEREGYRSGCNGPDSKSGCPAMSGARGFESHPLRHNIVQSSRFGVHGRNAGLIFSLVHTMNHDL